MKKYAEMAGDGGSGVAAQVEAQGRRLAARLASVGRVVVVMSGKGGVGKSVVTANLAAALAGCGARVGVVDADVNGPSIPLLLGARGRRVDRGPAGWSPVQASCGVRLVSTDLLVGEDGAPIVWKAPTQADAFLWRGAAEASAVREFLAETAWGELDWLLLDLPPGADRVPTVMAMLPAGALLLAVTIPTEVAVLSVRRAVVLARAGGWPTAGLVENMATPACPRCGASLGGEHAEGGPPSAVEGLALAEGLSVLGRIPYDPAVASCGDAGTPVVLARPESPGARALLSLAERLRRTP
ncbi:MAG: P-loop NTPase [Planctomycetes bacterium]|nr:P-loop NTPase [Planctomycetota bacterium]